MTLPRHISGYRSRILNAIIERLRIQRPIPGPGIRIAESPGGTVLSLAPAATGGGAYPWGPRWLFGFEFGSDYFRVHNCIMQVGSRPISIVAADAGHFTPGDTYVTWDDIPAADSDDEWGAALEVDFAGVMPSATAPVVVEVERYMSVPDAEPDDQTAPGRIPIAWFRGRAILRDYIHGLYVPQVWV